MPGSPTGHHSAVSALIVASMPADACAICCPLLYALAFFAVSWIHHSIISVTISASLKLMLTPSPRAASRMVSPTLASVTASVRVTLTAPGAPVATRTRISELMVHLPYVLRNAWRT